MSSSIRFLGVAILAWAAVRAISLGLVPGAEALAFDANPTRPEPPRLPPIQPTALPPIEPMGPAYQPAGQTQPYALPQAYGPDAGGGAYPGYGPYPVYIPVISPSLARPSPPQIVYLDRAVTPPAEINVYGGTPPVTNPAQVVSSPPSEAATAAPARQSTPSFGELKLPRLPRRLSLSGWAMTRNRSGSDSLASAGQLGGSQAGARLLWRFDPHLSASLRASAPINSQRGIEAAAGVRYQPFQGWPVALTLERRQAFGAYGQSAFAAFAEGGLYGRSMPWNSTLDAYFQGGVVDFNHPVWFVDGQAAVSRPVWRNLSAGLGVWGGAQPGLNRLDVGPRASMRIGRGMRMHVDYRYRVIGNAVPGSGTAVTLAADF